MSYPKWTIDQATDANGHITIRLYDGSEHGNIDAQPIATVYNNDDALLIVNAPVFISLLNEAHIANKYGDNVILDVDWFRRVRDAMTSENIRGGS